MNTTKPNHVTSASIGDYLAICRLDHSTKHIFIIPGIILAYLLRGTDKFHPQNLIFGFGAAICIASANYCINEYLDRNFDRHHPTKSQRTSVQKYMSGRIVFLQWTALTIFGIWLCYLVWPAMLFAGIIFSLQGVVYNVPPIRSKNIAFLDVISESINNPVRLTIGWAMIDPTTLPPSSIILSYWAGGAFLMAAKRFSEYREITASHGHELLSRYRASFARYSDISLNVSCLIYSTISVACLTVFVMKYRIEYLILIPIVSLLFGYYLAISLTPQSSAQSPEKLYREGGLILLLFVLTAAFIAASFAKIPFVEQFADQFFITMK